MLVYLSAPYSAIENKAELMRIITHAAGAYMLANKGAHVVTPLYNHFLLGMFPEMGHDYEFWKSYSLDLLRRCDKLVVLKIPGWQKSTGVTDEIRIASELQLPIEYL